MKEEIIEYIKKHGENLSAIDSTLKSVLGITLVPEELLDDEGREMKDTALKLFNAIKVEIDSTNKVVKSLEEDLEIRQLILKANENTN